MRDDERANYTQSSTGGSQAGAPAQDNPEDVASLNSPCEANGDLSSLFIHDIRNRPVEALRAASRGIQNQDTSA